jgi:hypothetical protein
MAGNQQRIGRHFPQLKRVGMKTDTDGAVQERRDFLKGTVAFCIGGFAPLLTAQVQVAAASMGKCRYCGSASFGSGCIHSPHKKHEHIADEKKCEFCGSASYGSGCLHSPTHKHRHGHGANKCIWCGSTSSGAGCIHSPTGRHEK